MTAVELASGPRVRALPAGHNNASFGFKPASERLHRSYNLTIALVFLAVLAPLMLLISIALVLTQGFRIFYFGPRIGRDRQEFNIIKFRTLDGKRAASLTSATVLPDGTGIETPLGKYLRSTRLDELPQLVNVLIGDMNMCGPRPVRPEMAALYRERMSLFDDRFTVRPGLVGHSQAFMSHGTSETIRERYNIRLCRAPVRYVSEMILLLTVGSCVMLRGASSLASGIAQRFPAARNSAVERGWPSPQRVKAAFISARSGRRVRVAGVDGRRLILDDHAGAVDPSGAGDPGWLELRLPDGSKRRARIVLIGPCGSGSSDRLEFEYQPGSDFADYLISRYLLMTVVVPHRSMLPPAMIRRRLARAVRHPRPAGVLIDRQPAEL